MMNTIRNDEKIIKYSLTKLFKIYLSRIFIFRYRTNSKLLILRSAKTNPSADGRTFRTDLSGLKVRSESPIGSGTELASALPSRNFKKSFFIISSFLILPKADSSNFNSYDG